MKHKIEYLPKPIGGFPTNWVIVTTEEEFYHVQSLHVDVGYQDEWTLGKMGCDGIVHFYDRFIIVCLPLDTNLGTMVHESVHVFQAMVADANEDNPGKEVTAYCIQFIFEQMKNYIERKNVCAQKTLASTGPTSPASSTPSPAPSTAHGA